MGGGAADGEHPLQQMGVDAQPAQSLANVADEIGHAAVLSQGPHQRVQVAKEFFVLSCQFVGHVPVLVAP